MQGSGTSHQPGIAICPRDFESRGFPFSRHWFAASVLEERLSWWLFFIQVVSAAGEPAFQLHSSLLEEGPSLRLGIEGREDDAQ